MDACLEDRVHYLDTIMVRKDEAKLGIQLAKIYQDRSAGTRTPFWVVDSTPE